MSVYFKFKSTKEFNSLPIVGQFISVGNLKERIFNLKHLGRGTDIDLIISNAQTNEEYTDEDVLIPRNASVLIRRVPGRPRMRGVANYRRVKAINHGFGYQPAQNSQNVSSSSSSSSSSFYSFDSESEWDEDSRLRAILETNTYDWSSQNDGPSGRGRIMRGRGFGNGEERGLFENRNPPPGYVCHRCNISGHFIQHCSTNGNPAYDPKRFKPPSGIPKSMLMTTPDGFYTLPGGVVAVLQPDEAAFEKAIEGIPTLARAAAISNVYLYKKRYSGLNQSVSMEKFIDQHMLDLLAYFAFYTVILSSTLLNTFTFLSFFVIPLTFRTRLFTGEIWSFKFKCLKGI
ncbi:E3 ubiquitin ligase PARAQUAT TOLERANCE 3-like isoform X2 [Carex rostrata]